jgi:hypothetical protein
MRCLNYTFSDATSNASKVPGARPCSTKSLPHGTTAAGRSNQLKEVRMRGTGRVVFAATLLLIVGTLNIIYGIGALDDANIFVNDQRFILTNPQHPLAGS